MTLYLLRHGLAAAAAPGQPDRSRPLTSEGVARMRLQVAFLEAAGVGLDHVLSSPYLRARQTADLVGEALGVPVEEERQLGCGCTFDDAVELLGRYDAGARVLLVGHQPDLGRIVERFTGARAAVEPGTLAALAVDRLRPRGALLVGLYAPDLAVRLGHALS